MRLCFFGTPPPAVPALEAMLADPEIDVLAVVTNPDRPSGRGYKLTPPPVKVTAEKAGVPVWQPEKAREILDDLATLEPHACAVVAYGALLPQDVLDAGGAGFVNLHFSLLPAWRGAAPVQHSILAGDARTGVSCFVLEAGMDTGPVLATAEVDIGAEETAGELMARLARLGAPVLVRAVKGLVDGSIAPVPQDHDAATLAPKVTSDDARLQWTTGAVAVHRAVRAFNPVPGAWTTFRSERLKIHRVTLSTRSGEAGAVLDQTPEGPLVGCTTGSVVLSEVQPAGKPRMTGAAFVNGYRPVGEHLGDE